MQIPIEKDCKEVHCGFSAMFSDSQVALLCDAGLTLLLLTNTAFLSRPAACLCIHLHAQLGTM
jgi:hypothetical protein